MTKEVKVRVMNRISLVYGRSYRGLEMNLGGKKEMSRRIKPLTKLKLIDFTPELKVWKLKT